ncbi:molecular chaperone HtpG [Prosthecobacter dejongeii]|uniref:Chaperone protein HtpG n=1 Tax=Prosthecobacter dejongeii TaxID=48465 RepID=A0A7W7YNI0_9BACT|nr:molecular chaperone HtpG [Prosthecobacter dejongeii]MBB5039436.1 molecular chaperone HtpG [Prosthecobacter dejongeii]
MSNTTTGSTHEFQAEVKQVLDIVIHSLYTDREIFIRELVSNAADALEKMRLTQLTENDVFGAELPLEIHITTDETEGTLTISDHGIGMTRAELVENLGTIAHSGSKAFAAALKNAGKSGDASVIGQFGVGFYSAFMVADYVKVYTHSWRQDGEHLVWESTGTGTYSIDEAPDQVRGCKIVIKLKEDALEFCRPDRVKAILAKYSNFVSFPIQLNAERVNTVEAIWLKSKDEVTEEQYKAFYQFTAHAFDEPSYRLHFQADAPLVINALLFLPEQNMESFGMGQMEPGVGLYCKKVLIDPRPKKLLPEWMRFVRGVIDSEDLPLNISRESMQDSALVRKLGEVVTKRLLKFLDKEAQDDGKKFQEFYAKFSRFFKEGVATDFLNRDAIAKLLRFDSSLTGEGEVIGLADYVARMKEEQKAIYYQVAPSRKTIETGPYLEAFKSKGYEVLYLYEPIDEYVVNSLREFDGKPLQAVNSNEVDLGDLANEGESLSEGDTETLCGWLKDSLASGVEEVRSGKRLVNSPALAITPDGEMTPQMRQMMRAMKPDEVEAPKVILEINPRHEIVKKLSVLSQSDGESAQLIAEQVLDNALLSAGLLDDPQRIVARTEKIMERLLAK